jgi:hypothetical protein
MEYWWIIAGIWFFGVVLGWCLRGYFERGSPMVDAMASVGMQSIIDASKPGAFTEIPLPGQKWWIKPKSNGDPFGPKAHSVKILAVRNGWVNYSFGSYIGLFNDERMELKSFLGVYQSTKPYTQQW